MPKIDPTVLLMAWLRDRGEPFETEYRFHPVRRWRIDVALVERRIAIEIEGGVFVGGRHTRGREFIKDCEKYNTAASLGWRVLRFAPEVIQNGEAFALIEATIRQTE